MKYTKYCCTKYLIYEPAVNIFAVSCVVSPLLVVVVAVCPAGQRAERAETQPQSLLSRHTTDRLLPPAPHDWPVST